VLFPAEVLPIVSCSRTGALLPRAADLAGAFLIYYRVPARPADLLWLPVVVLVQLVFTLGLALLLSALTVHFRDLKDLLANLLTLWFFATPIIYPIDDGARARAPAAGPEPVHAPGHLLPGDAVLPGPFTSTGPAAWRSSPSSSCSCSGYFVFDRLRDTLAEEV
jgi:lipopolysaccharide transport system permease protein